MSRTRQTMTAAISIGLPALSLTFSFSLLRLWARNDILRFDANGFTHQKPLSLTVPT